MQQDDQNEQTGNIETMYENFHEALYTYLINWRNDFTISDFYHRMIHIWAVNIHAHFDDSLNNYECGLYHLRLLNFTKDFNLFKISDHNQVYYFINNVYRMLGDYLKNIDKDYASDTKREMRWEIAHLLSLDYWIAKDKHLVSFCNYKSVSFNQNKYYASYGQVLAKLTNGNWDIKYKNKKIYPRFNYPESFCSQIFEEFVDMLLMNCPQILDDIEFKSIYRRINLKSGITDFKVMDDYLLTILSDKELIYDICSDFVSEYLDWDDLFFDGLDLDDFYKCYLSIEEYQRLKTLQKRKLGNLKATEMKQILDEIQSLSFKATQWTSYLRLNFCSLDKKTVSGTIFHDDYMKLL